MTTWNVKSGQIFELLDQESECFDTSQVYSAIKNHRIHVTTFSVLLSVKKNIAFFELPDQKIYVLICHKYIVRKKQEVVIVCFLALKIFNILVFYTSLELFQGLLIIFMIIIYNNDDILGLWS